MWDVQTSDQVYSSVILCTIFLPHEYFQLQSMPHLGENIIILIKILKVYFICIINRLGKPKCTGTFHSCYDTSKYTLTLTSKWRYASTFLLEVKCEIKETSKCIWLWLMSVWHLNYSSKYTQTTFEISYSGCLLKYLFVSDTQNKDILLKLEGSISHFM